MISFCNLLYFAVIFFVNHWQDLMLNYLQNNNYHYYYYYFNYLTVHFFFFRICTVEECTIKPRTRLKKEKK